MTINNNIITIFLILLALVSFFIGFSLDEISMGAGGFDGDFKWVKKSILLFSENSIKESVLLFTETSNRPPLIYILHKLFNPYFTEEQGFRVVVFVISLSIPILFYLCLKERFRYTEKKLLLLLSSVMFLNPFFRTASFWGLEENYAVISTLASLFFLLKLSNLDKKNSTSLFFNIFFVTLFSSLSIYFDQKFLIIPLICFFRIIAGNYFIKFKLFTLILYFLFSIPFLYLIKLWGNVFPSDIYYIGTQFHFHHFGYALTIIAFIFFPFIFLKSENIVNQLLIPINSNKIFISLIIITSYIITLIFYYDDSFLNNRLDGGGIIKKISLIFFTDSLLRKIFILFSFFISWFFILFFINKNKYNLSLTIYFLIISVMVVPMYQEYFDPIIFILLFFVYKLDLKLNFRKVCFFYFYFLIFLIGTNLYYK